MRTTPRVFGSPAPRGAGIITNAAHIALAALLLATGRASAADWTVERMLDAVRANDPGVRAAHAAGDAGRAQASQTWAMLSPHVSASAGFTRSDDPAVLFSQRLWQGRFSAEDFALNSLNQPDPRSALQLGVTVDQPLWNGGRELSVPGLARHYGRAATAMERASVADRLLGAVEAYVAVVRAREDERSARQSLAAARAMREAATQRFRMGLAPELDTLRAATHDAQARVQASAMRQRLAVATEYLSRLVHADVTADSLAIAGAPPVADGGGSRGELVAAREGAAAAGSESRTAALRLLPSINSRFSLTQYRPWNTAGNDAFERRWMVAVSADLPLFDGGQRINEWRAARAKAAGARATAEALERDLATALARARVEADVTREREGAARDGRAAAEEALRLAESRYQAGLLPLTDLLATDAEAGAARAAETEATTAVTLAHYRLLHALGELR